MTARNSASVRVAKSDDLDRVAFVWHQSAGAMDAAVPQMPSYEELRARIDRELEAGWQLVVAEQGERIVGILALKPHQGCQKGSAFAWRKATNAPRSFMNESD